MRLIADTKLFTEWGVVADIATLLHDGSGPRYANIEAADFPEKLVEYAGKVNQNHQLWRYLSDQGVTLSELSFYIENPVYPDVLGFNYYIGEVYRPRN